MNVLTVWLTMWFLIWAGIVAASPILLTAWAIHRRRRQPTPAEGRHRA